MTDKRYTAVLATLFDSAADATLDYAVSRHDIHKMVQAGGLEPPAYFLGGSRSILMSYACTKNLLNTFYLNCQPFNPKRKNILHFEQYPKKLLHFI